MTGDECSDECRKRWKCIRDKFVRELKKVNRSKSGDAGPSCLLCWPFYKVLLFFKDTEAQAASMNVYT